MEIDENVARGMAEGRGAVDGGVPPMTDTARETVNVPKSDWEQAQLVGRHAMHLINWLYGPNTGDMLEEMATVSGIAVGHILDIGDAFGATRGDWPDEPGWLSESTPAAASTKEEKS